MKAADAAASPAVIELSGKRYLLSPLDDKRIGTFERFLQDRVMDVAKRNAEGLSPERADALLLAAFERASRVSMGSVDALQMMQSIEVIIFLVWLSLNKAQPELTLDETYSLLLDPDNLTRVTAKINDLQGKTRGVGSKAPTTPRRTKRRRH